MAIIGDIIDNWIENHIINDIHGWSKSSEKLTSNSTLKNSNSSIKTKTQNLIMQFPLLISDRLSYDTAKDLADGIERENALLVKLLILNDLGGLTSKANSTTDVLEKIHTNINATPIFESKRNLIEENLKQMILIESKFNNFSLNNGTLPKYLIEANYETNKVMASTENKEFSKDMCDKVNKLQPTFISMNITVGDKNHCKQLPILFGVKCVVHPLKSEDIINNINTSFKDSTLFKMVKWTTGEYSFAQGIGEIVFDFNRMKTLGIQAGKESNYWWFKLKKLKNGNKTNKFFGKNTATKTTTIFISSDEVDILKNNYNVDIKQSRVAMKLMDDLFLLNFGYVDESTEMVYIFDETTATYHVKKLDEFRSKTKEKTITVDDIKSLFGR